MTREADAPSAPWENYRPGQRWWFLTILFLVSLSSYIDRHIMAVLLEPIKVEFGASDTMMGLLGGFAFAAFYAVLGIPIARLADRGDRKLVITLSLAMWSLMSVLCGLARSFPQLLLARVGVGAGEAGAFPPAQSLIADYFPPEQRARAIGIFLASATIGYLVAFTIGTQIAVAHGWRTAFVALGAPGLLLCLLTWFGLAEPRRHARRSPEGHTESLAETLGALAGKRSFVLLCCSAILYWLFSYGALIWFPAYLVRVMKLDLATVGAVYGLVFGASALIGSVAGGFVTDAAARRGPRASVRISAIVLIGAAPCFEIALFSDDVVIFFVGAFFGGLALAAAAPALFTILHRVCGSPRRAMAVAIFLFFANLIGLGVGPVITGAMSDTFSAAYGPVGLRYALMIAVVTLIPAGGLLWMIAKTIEDDIES